MVNAAHTQAHVNVYTHIHMQAHCTHTQTPAWRMKH